MAETPMTKENAARIQSDADKTGKNQDFKGRAQSAADKQKGEAEKGGTPKK
jgi:hypothetical protein